MHEHALQLGLHVDPDLGEDLARGATERTGMQRPEGLDLGVVVEQHEVGAPVDRQLVRRAQADADGGSQALRPALAVADGRLRPVEAADPVRHLAVAEDGRQGWPIGRHGPSGDRGRSLRPGPWRRQSVESNESVSACFEMIASAPHELGGAPSASAPSTEMSTITTDGSSSRIRRAASAPPIPGMRTSIRMKSGRSSGARVTASSPEAASPARSNSAAGSSTSVRTIRLKASWSSTASTPQYARPAAACGAAPTG